MAKLTTKQRKKLPKKDFGLVEDGKRKYPMPDKSHAANAKARAQQQYDKGNLSKGELEKIDKKANKVLGEKKPKDKMATKPKRAPAKKAVAKKTTSRRK